MTLNYTMIPGELRIQPPEIIIQELSITQENSPCIKVEITKGVQTSGYSEPFKYHFHCKVKDKEEWLDIDFDFFEDEPIEYGSSSWVEAVEKWLFPYLNINQG